MENQDKNIDKHFRKLSEEQEPKSFPNMDKVWDNIEQKLDKKDKKKAFPFWKYAGIAAALLVFVTLGINFLKQTNPEELPLNSNQRMVIDETKSKKILEKELEKQEDIYAYEEVNSVEKEVVKDKPRFSEPVIKKDDKTEKETVTKQEDFNDDKHSGQESREAEKDVDFKMSGTQTGGADKGSKGTGIAYDYDMNELIVDSYRTTSKVASHTAASTVTSKTIEGRPNASFIQTLQGQVPGLNISTGSGQPGTNNSVVLRGIGSINSNTEPLYVIDGVPMSANRFRSLNQKDIESIKVLKGAEATAIYGNRGANGVIDITTKKGTKKKSRKERKKEKQESVSYQEIQKMFPPVEIDSESYESFQENPFESAQSNPVSTFSIDVDNASYTNIRRFINNGQTVPKDAVRVEEMINFFKYDYPQPNTQHPFSINTEYSEAPWNPNHKLLKIGLKGKEIPADKLPKSNFVFLVDVSGSMESPNKLPLLKSSMKVLLDELREDDRVSIVYYASGTGVLLEPTKASEKKKIIKVIDDMRAGGGTSGAAGLDLAYQMAEKNFIKNGNNRIILATDGDFNIGKSSDKEMQELIEEKRKSGVFLTCLGFGMGNYKDSKMVTLSKKGNGNYAYIDNIQEANRFLGKEFKGSMFAIAKDVKIQIEFNPAHVQAYRLVGYEMRKLRNEDFTNDAIDAGELGSGHTVTALYEVIPNGVKSAFYLYENDLKYTKNTASDSFQNELATVKFRYKKPKEDKSIEMVHTVENKPTDLKNASKDFKFASAVAWFGLKLRDSKLIPNKESTDISKLAREGIHNDNDGYKAEFIRLVESVK